MHKPSDIFGADSVVWVEGSTEEECFPKIIRTKGIKGPEGLVILAIKATGDFEGRRARAVAIWEIYHSLSAVGGLTPTTVAISLDTEGRSDSDIAEARERSRGLVHFLPRRCFENYLINPPAIAATLNTLPTFSEQSTDEVTVQRWLREHGRDAKYYLGQAWNGDLYDEQWLSAVKGAALLSDLFQDLSDQKEEYRKVKHGAEITEWICEHEPRHFDELASYLARILEISSGEEQSYSA
jgi:hypothetical protein